MSDNGEVEVENPSGYYPALPKDVQTDSVKLFGKWSYVSRPGKIVLAAFVWRQEG